jgi:hypothetical protein
MPVRTASGKRSYREKMVFATVNQASVKQIKSLFSLKVIVLPALAPFETLIRSSNGQANIPPKPGVYGGFKICKVTWR